ncbi:MAG: Tim44/TimA family putative adaptor protein [Rickettsiaceae bacterium]
MSGQLLELIIFAGIAFFIINKLISTLGSTSNDDPAKNKSFFGENFSKTLKDVTYTGSTNVLKPNLLKAKKLGLKDLVLSENKESVEKGLQEVLSKVPTFDVRRFVGGAKSAFQMIIEAALQGDDDQLEELVDKRYIENFKSIAVNYGGLTGNVKKLSVQISEIYMFGNNIFIKVLLLGSDVTEKIKDLHEEWTFSKSALSSDPAWHLTNIDRPQ